MIVPSNANTTTDNVFMTGKESYEYYNTCIWNKRYASCLSIEEVMERMRENRWSFFKRNKKDHAIYSFVYDKTYNEYTGIINTIEFQCKDCINEIVEYAKAYPTCLKIMIKHWLVDSVFDYESGIYKEQTLSQALHEPAIMLISSADGTCTYIRYSHIIIVEFSGVFEQIYNVLVDG